MGEHHVWDLSQDLGTTPGPKSKPTTNPTALPDHILSLLMEKLKQASLDNDLVDFEAILDQFNLYGKTCQDYLKFDCSELTKL